MAKRFDFKKPSKTTKLKYLERGEIFYAYFENIFYMKTSDKDYPAICVSTGSLCSRIWWPESKEVIRVNTHLVIED